MHNTSFPARCGGVLGKLFYIWLPHCTLPCLQAAARLRNIGKSGEHSQHWACKNVTNEGDDVCYQSLAGETIWWQRWPAQSALSNERALWMFVYFLRLNAIIDHSCWTFILHELSLKCDDFKLTHSKLWTVGKIFSWGEKNVLLFIKLSACVHHHTINHKLFVLKLFYDLFYNNLQLELARGRSITNNLVDKIKNGLWNTLGNKKINVVYGWTMTKVP